MKNRQRMVPPYAQQFDKPNKIVLPVTMAILGASVVIMAVMLLTKDKTDRQARTDHDVENYDIVGDQPFIFGICE